MTDLDKQFILQGEEHENFLNHYFDDIFNKLVIEHSVVEKDFNH